MNKRSFSLWCPPDVITKAFGSRSSRRVEKNNLAYLFFARLGLGPFPGGESFPCGAGCQKKYPRTLLRCPSLKWMKFEGLTFLPRDLIRPRGDNCFCNIISTNLRLMYFFIYPVIDTVSFELHPFQTRTAQQGS